MEDRPRRSAALRPLTGFDEAYLISLRDRVSPPRWTSEILARCLLHLGGQQPVTLDLVRKLAVGDREALLLHLRRLTFGEQLSCVLSCPGCGARLGVDLTVSQLLLPPYETRGYWFRLTLPESDLTVIFRLPTGADQEAVAHLAAQDPHAATKALATRCTQSVARGDETLEHLPVPALPELANLIGKRDAQAELILNNQCPDCGLAFDVLLDMSTFFAEEINQRLPHLYREIHLLAWYYHWSEAEILGMTRAHRRIYLNLLDESTREVTK
jgi:hypothetical protein